MVSSTRDGLPTLQWHSVRSDGQPYDALARDRLHQLDRSGRAPGRGPNSGSDLVPLGRAGRQTGRRPTPTVVRQLVLPPTRTRVAALGEGHGRSVGKSVLV